LAGDLADYEGKTVLVTGGAGFIGSHLVEMLVELSARVTVIDNLRTGSVSNLKNVVGKVSLVNGDIAEPETFENIERPEIIFNEAANALVPSFRDPYQDLKTNTGGVISILEFARRIDARVIHASTGSIYGNPVRLPIDETHPLNPISPYGVSKLCAELYCNLYTSIYRLSVTCLRYFNVYGPRQRVGEETGVIPIFVSNAVNGRPLAIFGDGNQTRDFVFVKDVVRANLLAGLSKSHGESMNVGGKGRELSIKELAFLIGKLLRKKISLDFRDPKPGDIRRLVADSSKAKRLISYSPEVSLERGLESYISFFLGDKE